MTELETLKAQLAASETWLERVRLHNQQLQLRVEELANVHMNRGHELRASEAQVRELRNLVSGIRLLCLCALDIAVVDDIRKLIDEAALRSAPPSGPDSALTADVAQNMRSTAGSWYAQFPLAKTNAGEERKDLARQGSDASGDAIEGEQSACSSPKQPQSIPKQSWDGVSSPEPFSEASEQVPAARIPNAAQAEGNSGSSSSTGRASVAQTEGSGFESQDERSAGKGSPSRSEWISVEERLPEVGKDVLVVLSDNGDNPIAILAWMDSAYRFGKDSRWDDKSGDSFQNHIVTHWQPLPAPPSPAHEKEKAE